MATSSSHAIEVPFNQSRKFILVEYPGIVKDKDKMLATLGGENAVSKTHADPSRRLELRFRPEDVFCKPTCADRFRTTNLLMRVVRKRVKQKQAAECSTDAKMEFSLHAEILGVVDTTYR